MAQESKSKNRQVDGSSPEQSKSKLSQKKFAYSKSKSMYFAKAVKFLIRARSCGVEHVDEEGNIKLKRKARLSPQQFEIAMFLLQAFLKKDKAFERGLVYKKMCTLSLMFAEYSNYLNRDELGHSSVPEDKVMKNTLKKLKEVGLIDFERAPDREKGKRGILVTYITFNNI